MPASKPARNPAAEITALIIEKLETGTAPWSRPWRTQGVGGRPLRHDGNAYAGINALHLWAVSDARAYRSRYWMTYRQATTLGGQVRRKETGSPSVYYSIFNKVEGDPATGNEAERQVRFLKWYTVFNADQIDGLPAHFYASDDTLEPVAPSLRQRAIDLWFAAIPADVRHGGDHAYFDRSRDYIQLPAPSAFRSMDHYASVRAHETIHWSGAEIRLARSFGRRFGDAAYAFEELVAEIGAGFVCSELGLPNELHDGHASYVAHWLRILRSDASAIIHAAAKAEQACAFLRSFSENDRNPGPAMRGPAAMPRLGPSRSAAAGSARPRRTRQAEEGRRG